MKPSFLKFIYTGTALLFVLLSGCGKVVTDGKTTPSPEAAATLTPSLTPEAKNDGVVEEPENSCFPVIRITTSTGADVTTREDYIAGTMAL